MSKLIDDLRAALEDTDEELVMDEIGHIHDQFEQGKDARECILEILRKIDTILEIRKG